jgi:hypothetical protein
MDIYKLRKKTDGVAAFWRDGNMLASYHGNLHMIAGWNDSFSPALTNDHYISDNNGATWIQQAETPFANRHTGGVGVYNDKIWIWGGDHYMDLWKYDDVNKWVQVSANWSVDTVGREHFHRTVHKGYAYVAGGHRWNEPANKQNSIYKKSLDSTGDAWTKVCDLPTAMQNIDSGCLVSFKGDLYLFGGGRVDLGLPYPVNTKVWKSTDDGATWAQIADTPLLNSFIWGDAVATNSMIFGLSGSDTNNSMTGSNNRIVYTEDGITWSEYYMKIPGRHATGMCVHEDDIIMTCGYNRNDCWQLKKISSKYRCYSDIYRINI